MRLSRFLMLVLVLCLAISAAGLVGCSSDEEPSSDEAATESTTESSDPMIGTWENSDAFYYQEITFEEGGAGVVVEDGVEKAMEWSLSDGLLEITVNLDEDGGTDSSSAGFEMVSDTEFTWDIDGIYLKAD